MRWLVWALAALILALAAWLRLYRLGDQSLWTDEVASVLFAGLAPADIWGADTHPPLFYLLLHFWMEWFGQDEYALRLLSAGFSLATLLPLYLLGRRIGGPCLGLAAILVFAASPFAVEYAQELRMYSLLEFLVAWALVGLAGLLRDPERAAKSFRAGAAAAWGDWCLLGTGTLLALYTHHMAVLLPLTTTLLALAFWWTRPERPVLARNWIIVHGLVLLGWAPYWPELINQAAIPSWYWIRLPDVMTFLHTQLRIDYGIPNGGPFWLWTAAACFLSLTMLGWRALPKDVGGDVSRGPGWRTFLAAAIVIPPLAAVLLSWLFRPIYLGRTLIWTELPAAVLLGAGVLAALSGALSGALSWRWRSLGAALLAATVVFDAYGLWHLFNETRNAEWRNIAETVLDNSDADELVVAPYGKDSALDYYVERLAQASGERPPEVMGPVAYWPIRLFELMMRLPERDRFLMLEIPWLRRPLSMADLLALRFPCHRASEIATRGGAILWRYERREDCS